MPTVIAAPNFVTRDPELVRTTNAMAFSLSVLNTGDGAAENLIVTDMTLGSARRLEPALPLPVGDVGPTGGICINGRFSPVGLVSGNKYLLTVRGRYRLNGLPFGFTLNRFVTIPGTVAAAVRFLAARLSVQAELMAGEWFYTVSNDEPAGSHHYVSSLSLDMNAPFVVVRTPPGWSVETDNFSYILWQATSASIPWPGHVAPGAYLGGFKIQSPRNASEGRAFAIGSWNHSNNTPELVAFGSVLTPQG